MDLTCLFGVWQTKQSISFDLTVALNSSSVCLRCDRKCLDFVLFCFPSNAAALGDKDGFVTRTRTDTDSSNPMTLSSNTEF